LLLSAPLAGDIASQLPAPRISSRRAQQQQRHSTARSSKCGQCRVDSPGTRLNTETQFLFGLLLLFVVLSVLIM